MVRLVSGAVAAPGRCCDQGLNPDPAMGTGLGGFCVGWYRVGGAGTREQKVSSFEGHGSAAMRRLEAHKGRTSAGRDAAGDTGPMIAGATCMECGAAASLRWAPGGGMSWVQSPRSSEDAEAEGFVA